MTILLASSSPRRKELMKLLNLPFKVISKHVDERINSSLSPAENVKHLAMQKALAVAKDYPEALVIGCDTVVVMGDQIIGKPKDEKNAKDILCMLSGKTHDVYTGVAVIALNEAINNCFYEKTSVDMDDVTLEEIAEYLATGEPMDKAGAYGIQGIGARYISGIKGDYYNVVGLPVHRLYKIIKNYSVSF